MYSLYFSPGACSLATHTILNMLNQKTELIHVSNVKNFEAVNPSKMVPVLKDGDTYLTEGAAIILYLLEKHENNLMAKAGASRQKAIENMMLANATMHPAYGRLFFASANMEEGKAKDDFFKAAAETIDKIWLSVENKISEGPFLGGHSVSPADILLTVYSDWGQYFPVDINIGPKAQQMIKLVQQSEAFKLASQKEADTVAN
ncbi:glutathione S-transferase family protein [Lacimicrobium sp. SS2-24]|uniref:glutathione S-transferase family protein n=1 Tax=Lacimicrobium sp. SS2-24 TaxID=2005569 RepID=UPI000B4B9905|nr:glutathione S-transferase family protein [Lacimicrobium sp. SS2-24]